MLFNLSLLGCSSYVTGVIIDDTGSQSMTMTWNEVYVLGFCHMIHTTSPVLSSTANGYIIRDAI